MIQTNKGIAQPRNENIIMAPSRRPKGLGRQNPHSAEHTRKLKGRHGRYDSTALAIERGLTKMSMFLMGKHHIQKPKKSSNPFTDVVNKFIKKGGLNAKRVKK